MSDSDRIINRATNFILDGISCIVDANFISVSDRNAGTGVNFIVIAEYIGAIRVNDIARADDMPTGYIPFPSLGGADDIVPSDHV